MNRYALVVGVGQYVAPNLANLARARADAQGVYDLLKAHGDFDEIHLLQDAQATYASLYERLEYVLLKQGAKAEVLIYFSGHGLTAGANRFAQQGHLATHDCVLKEAGEFWAVEKGIDFQLLNGLIAEADVAGLAVFLDCCHSERFIEQALMGKGLSSFGERQYFLSTACRGYEFAYENKGEPYSAYTGALLQALGNKDAGSVTVTEAHVAVRRLLKGTGQEPVALNYGSDFGVVDYRRVVAAQVVSEVCPYQGLRAFTPETKGVFFGREGDTRQLVQKLAGSNFVMVLGPSGSGKSSVVRAGLVTRLVAQDWQVVTMKPDSSPMAILKMEMRAFLSGREVAAGEKRELLRTLETEGLGVMVQQLAGDERVLLLVDQFEEVFTLCDRDQQQRFVSELLKVRELVDSRLAVVVTMRSDFVNEWLAVGYPAAVIDRDVVWLGPLRGENLRDAIVKPARKQGYNFGEGLLELLLADVAAEDNCLPLLEFALTELWEKRDTQARKMTAAAYREMGGLKGALNERAETVYNSLREVDKPWVKRVFLRLVRLGKGEKDTRQRQLKKHLLAMGGLDVSQNEQQQQTRQMIADVIQALVSGRLVVVDGDYIDLAHEALLDGWMLFAQWRQEDRDLRRLEQRMGDEYETWKRVKDTAGKDEHEYLLKGGLLAEVREQQESLIKRLEESRPLLMKYFADSDREDAETVAMLQRALADANVRAASLKVRDKLLNNPARTVEATLSALVLVGKSQKEFQGVVVYPAQDALHRAWFKIRENLKLEGHSDSVMSVAFSPQGDRIISGSADKTLRQWDLEGNPVGLPFEGHSDSVMSVAFSPQGDRIISGSADKTLRQWDLKGNAVGLPFEGHSDSVMSVAFSPQGDRIVSGSDDNTLRQWDLEGNPVGLPFEGHSGSVRSVAFSPQGDRIVSGSDDNTLRQWDLEGKVVGLPFEGHSDSVRSVAFNPQGDRIVSGSADRTLRQWDLEGKVVGLPFEGHSDWVRSVAFSPQGDRIVSASADNTLCQWDLEGNAVGLPFEGHSDWVLSVAFSPQGDRIVSGSDDNTLRQWDLEVKAVGSLFEGHSDSVLSVAFSPQGDRIVSGSADRTLRQWDLEGNAVGLPFEGHSDSVLSVAFSPQGDSPEERLRQRIVSGSADRTLRQWDLEGNAVGLPFEGHSGLVWSVAFSPQGDRIVSGSADKTLRQWDLEGNAVGLPFEGHSDSVRSVAFSPQGDRIVSGSDDRTLRQWDLEGNAIGLPFEGHSGSVRSVAFSPQGDRIVSGSTDRTLRQWDLEGNAIGLPFEGHSDWVRSVAFSPQGDSPEERLRQRIVSGSADRTLRQWDLEGNAVGLPFEGHSGLVWSVAFSPQGDRIVSGSDDNTLRLWRVGTWEDELRYCCNTLMHHVALVAPQTALACQACEVCEQVWTRQQSAAFVVAQGSAQARQGDIECAVEKFNRAKELDPTLTLEPLKRATELYEWSKA